MNWKNNLKHPQPRFRFANPRNLTDDLTVSAFQDALESEPQPKRSIIVNALEAYGGLGITCFVRDIITWLKLKLFNSARVPKHCLGCSGPKKCRALHK